MFSFLHSRKGFTLVELVIVLLLLSLGAVAMMNLITAGWRAFNKSEERFIKQEAVKTTVELLQKGTKITAANQAAVFPSSAVVPTGECTDDSYSFLFAKLEDRLDEAGQPTAIQADGSYAGDGKYDGYYLYVLNSGTMGKYAKQICDVPLYIEIKPMVGKEFDDTVDDPSSGVTTSADYVVLDGVIVSIMALDESFDYGTTSAPNTDQPTSDDVYYQLDVGYHFPNIATSKNDVLVNREGGELATAQTYDENGPIEYGSETATDFNVTTGAVETGHTLRVYIDSILEGDNSGAAARVPTFCFIATASYGQDSGEVGLLCNFRDNVLKGTALGDAFIKAYYTVSPPIAKLIAKSPALAAAVRAALKPLVLVATYALDRDLLAQNAVWLVMFGLCGLGSSATLVVLSKRLRREKRHGN